MKQNHPLLLLKKKKKCYLVEKKISKKFNGILTPGSGNKWLKGDFFTDNAIFEVKSTEKEFFRIEISIIEKIMSVSIPFDKEWYLIISISDNDFVICNKSFWNGNFRKLKTKKIFINKTWKFGSNSFLIVDAKQKLLNKRYAIKIESKIGEFILTKLDIFYGIYRERERSRGGGIKKI